MHYQCEQRDTVTACKNNRLAEFLLHGDVYLCFIPRVRARQRDYVIFSRYYSLLECEQRGDEPRG